MKKTIAVALALLLAGCATPPPSPHNICLVSVLGKTDDGRTLILQTCKPVDTTADEEKAQ